MGSFHMTTIPDTSPISASAIDPQPEVVPGTLRRCARCLYDEQTPSIRFDQTGVCNYCQIHDELDQQYPTGEEGEARLEQIANDIRRGSRRRKYDVVVGVSGGCDSSYMLLRTKQLGLRPLAVHFDNTWNSAIATQNIRNVLKVLDVDLYTYVVDNEEYDDIYRSFLSAGVPDIDTPTDIALAAVLYRAAEEHGIKYIFEGHSFRTEGIAPIGWIYMDGKYVESVQKAYGSRPLKTYPNLWLSSFLKWSALRRIRRIRPLYYIDYNKEAAKELMTRELDWTWYGGHHLENRFTQFLHSYFLPNRFGVDFRVQGHSALVRSGQLEREEGLRQLAEPHVFDPDVVTLLKKRLGFSDEDLERVMTQPVRSFRDFKTYKPLFERMRPFFWVLAKFDLVPWSFYLRYTSKSNI
jgi:N-acetyl sugar amidotransferase